MPSASKWPPPAMRGAKSASHITQSHLSLKSVRDRLGPYRAMIQTVWGVGYKFDPDVKIENL